MEREGGLQVRHIVIRQQMVSRVAALGTRKGVSGDDEADLWHRAEEERSGYPRWSRAWFSPMSNCCHKIGRF